VAFRPVRPWCRPGSRRLPARGGQLELDYLAGGHQLQREEGHGSRWPLCDDRFGCHVHDLYRRQRTRGNPQYGTTTVYYYVVTATSACGESGNSPEVPGAPIATIPPRPLPTPPSQIGCYWYTLNGWEAIPCEPVSDVIQSAGVPAAPSRAYHALCRGNAESPDVDQESACSAHGFDAFAVCFCASGNAVPSHRERDGRDP